MATLPLYVPVTISEKRAYTVKVYLCNGSLPLDTANLYVYALPVFAENHSVEGFKRPSDSTPSLIWFSAGDIMEKVVSWRTFTATFGTDGGLSSPFPSGSYRVFNRVSQDYNSGLPWSYADNTLTVTFNQGSAYPESPPNVDEFDSTAVPTQYVWSAVLSYANGDNFRIVDGSPVKLTFATTEDKPPPAVLSVCSAKVI